MYEHSPVLLNEVLSYWKKSENSIYFDCTFGRGGHTQSLLNVIDEKSQVYAFDVDASAIEVGEELSKTDSRFHIIYSNFVHLKHVWSRLRIPKVDGILFDFGVSSPQLDQDDRGFSYHHNARLDMRLDQNLKISAHDIINKSSLVELTNIFRWYGETPYAYQVAQYIVNIRQSQPINTTLQLVDIIKSALPTRVLHEKKHPCRVFFQALRIKVNNELQVIHDVLNQLEFVMKKNGVAIFITFHSLEEQVLKHWLKKNTGEIYSPNVPVKLLNKFTSLTKKPIVPTMEEINYNKRARSAKMWVVQKNYE